MPRREMRGLKRFCFASIYALLLIIIVGVNRLDAQVRTATISGTATDSSGAVLVGAKIVVKNLGTGITQSAITDSQGRYSMPDLPVGEYEVRASATGFQTVVRTGITLTVGGQPVADFTLPTGGQPETGPRGGGGREGRRETPRVSITRTPDTDARPAAEWPEFFGAVDAGAGCANHPTKPGGWRRIRHFLRAGNQLFGLRLEARRPIVPARQHGIARAFPPRGGIVRHRQLARGRGDSRVPRPDQHLQR